MEYIREELMVAQLIRKLPFFFGTQTFITVFTQESTTGLYLESYESNSLPHAWFPKIRFDIILRSTLRSPKRSLLFLVM